MRIHRARSWYRSGRYAEALELLARARADERRDLATPLLVAVCRAALGDLAGVPAAFDQGLELVLALPPSGLLPLDPLQQLIARGEAARDPGVARGEFADHRVRRALRLLHVDRCEEALGELAAALRLNPGYVEARLLATRASLTLGRPEAALAHLEPALAGTPEYADLHVWHGLAHARARRFGAAAAALGSALRLNRRFVRALRLQAAVEHALGRTASALRAARRAVLCERTAMARHPGREGLDLARAMARHPDYPDLHLALARHLRLEGRWAEARQACRRALELAPWLAAASVEMSRIELGLGAPDRARDRLQQLLLSRPRWADAQALFGRACLMSGDAARAEAALRAALELAPGFAAARSELGWALLAQGRATEARAAFAGARPAASGASRSAEVDEPAGREQAARAL